MAQLDDFISEWLSDLEYVEAHTSGSTGIPKNIRLLKSDMRSSAIVTNNFFGIDKQSVLALPLSLDYIAGKMMAVRAMIAGCRLLQLPVSNEVVITERVKLLSVVPSQLESLLANPNAPDLVDNLLIGGAPLDDTTRRRVNAAGFKAYIGYGMTETCSHVALRSLADDNSIYHGMLGIRFRTDSRGCLVIDSNRFSWETLITNDVVNLLDETSFQWLGRADNVINSGGVKLHPEMLENEILRQLPTLPPFFLTSKPDERWGERLVMVVECNPAEAHEFLEKISRLNLPRYGCPKEIISVDVLPRTSNGKLKRELS